MKEKVDISYDREADVLYLSYGNPRKAESEEVQDGVVARYDVRTRELVGITILNFLRRFGPEYRSIAVPSRL